MISPSLSLQHGVPPLEAPGFLPDPTGGPDEPVKSDLLFTRSERLQKCLQPLHSSTHAPPAVDQSQLHPVLLVSVWILSVGTVSASPMQPALCRHEDQVCPEEALQGLFLCPAAGAFVCLLQDPPETQAEAGIT